MSNDSLLPSKQGGGAESRPRSWGTCMDPERLERAYQTAFTALLAERTPEGHWIGKLSASALSTATAVSALALVQKQTASPFSEPIARGMAWLTAHQNGDGGWGDTIKSISNISTSMLCRAAFHLTDTSQQHPDSLRRLEDYIRQKCARPAISAVAYAERRARRGHAAAPGPRT